MRSALTVTLFALFAVTAWASEAEDAAMWELLKASSAAAAEEVEAANREAEAEKAEEQLIAANQEALYNKRYEDFYVKPHETAIVFLHGIWSKPTFQGGGLFVSERFFVSTPSMPWGAGRNYDISYEDALENLHSYIQRLRSDGIKRVVLGGHSFGGNGALAYASMYDDVDALLLLAPGFNPDIDYSGQFRIVAIAKEMVADGKGSSPIKFTEYNQGQTRQAESSAKNFLSFYDPDRMANMPKTASGMKKVIPVLALMSSADFLTRQGSGYFFDKLPRHPLSTYRVSTADHFGLPSVEAESVLKWTLGVMRENFGAVR